MFKNFFKKKEPVINEVFGTVGYAVAGWFANEKVKITLWNKTYDDIDVFVVARDRTDMINKNQEDAYEKFKNTIVERQNEVMEIIENYYKTKNEELLISKFTPHELIFGKKGQCALMAFNEDDEEEMHDVPPGLAVSFFPELKLYTEEEYLSYIFSKES